MDTDVRNQITTILYAMTNLSPRMPIVGECPCLQFDLMVNFLQPSQLPKFKSGWQNLNIICMTHGLDLITDPRTFFTPTWTSYH